LGTILRKKKLMQYQGIMDILKEEIASGRLKPGQRLTENQLMERFQLSRNKAREVLKQLGADGFVKLTPNIGAVVAEMSQKDIEHSYDLMGVLEGLSARVATPYITPQHLERLRLLMDKMEATKDPSTFLIFNNEFHALIASLSENDQLISITDNLRIKLRRFGLRALQNPLQIAASRTEHRKVFEAIKDNKPEKAEKAVRDHHLNAKNRLIKGMNKSL